MMRLNKFLAQAGIASRRKCDDLIMAGKVTVNGEVVQEMGVRIDENTDQVYFEGEPVNLPRNFAYVILNKPDGYVTTAKDEYKRHTVIDLVPTDFRLFPVGRLDYDTTGLLLLTNDGELSNQLTHPKFKFEKTYHVLLDKLIKPLALYHLRQGVMLDEKKTAPCKITEIRVVDNCSLLEVRIYEGRNRQIKRMFELFDYNVEQLDRIAFGPLTLRGLKRGEWRYLEQSEIDLLHKTVQLSIKEM